MKRFSQILICLFALSLLTKGQLLSETQNELNDGNPNQCVWYGNCWDISLSRHAPCVYDGPAKLVTDGRTMDLLLEWCPMYVTGNTTTYTCCNYDQLMDLSKEFTMMQQMLARCPSCFMNLATVFCAVSCDPHQSKFMRVSKKYIDIINDLKEKPDEFIIN